MQTVGALVRLTRTEMPNLDDILSRISTGNIRVVGHVRADYNPNATFILSLKPETPEGDELLWRSLNSRSVVSGLLGRVRTYEVLCSFTLAADILIAWADYLFRNG